MLIVLRPDDARPIYQQIVGQIKEQIMTGLLLPGDVLPSVRELAAFLAVNMHTVHRAYQELAEQKVVHMRLGQKVKVASTDTSGGGREEARLRIEEEIRRLIVDGYHMGFTRHELTALFVEQCGIITSKKEDF